MDLSTLCHRLTKLQSKVVRNTVNGLVTLSVTDRKLIKDAIDAYTATNPSKQELDVVLTLSTKMGLL